ncbi:MAG: hypothetical protein HY646_11275 [Acidobacteria bacterium]|nr:hypothetical protein [Acidobacteriota bacterium]
MSDKPVKQTVGPYPSTSPQNEFAPLIDALYRETVLEARRMPPEEKFLLGEELFEYACSITLAGIRAQNPEFTEEGCQQELQRRLDLTERMDRLT